MLRKLDLALAQFPSTPSSLRGNPAVDRPAPSVDVNLMSVSHHQFLDTHGVRPSFGQSQFSTLLQYATSDLHLRFIPSGLGAHAEAKRGIVNSLGRAFCRYLLHEHCNISYFAHIEQVLGTTLPAGFSGLTVKRAQPGDLPDYFCARDVRRVYIAEAKGRTSSIGFATKSFADWRQQLRRVQVVTPPGIAVRTKGYIVATRFLTTANGPRTRPMVCIEDPETEGEIDANTELPSPGGLVIQQHYASVFSALRLPLAAGSLHFGYRLPERLGLQVGVWRCALPALEQLTFVGGYLPVGDRDSAGHLWNDHNWILRDPTRAVDLSRPHMLFFGLEESRFASTLAAARRGAPLSELNFEVDENSRELPLDVSYLRDGTVMAPLEYFTLEDIRAI